MHLSVTVFYAPVERDTAYLRFVLRKKYGIRVARRTTNTIPL